MSSALANGVAGAGGGLIAQILTYPLQTVNTRQQTERVIKKGLAIDGGNQRPGGTLVQLYQVIKTEGWCGLYSGLKPSLIGTIASQGVYYYFYQVFKNRVESIATARKAKGLGDGNVGMISWLAVAAMAGCLNVLLTNPMWVLVTRMQINNLNLGCEENQRPLNIASKTQTQAERNIMERKREALLKEASDNSAIESTLLELAELESSKPKPYGTLQAAGEIYSEAGIRGFWKGLIPTLIMVCNPSIQFMIYETSLRSLKEKRATTEHGVKQITALEVFFLGALAKLGATVTTYPLLVVKSRLQAKQDIGSNVSLRYSGTLDAIVKMIRYEGFLGFYKGMSTKIVQSVFAASVLFMVKEELVKAFTILAYRSRKIRLNALR